MINNNMDFNKKVGDLLVNEFLIPNNLSQNALSIAIHVPSTRIHEIIKGRRRITIDTDLRLCKFFKLPDGHFYKLQEELERKIIKQKIENDLNTIVPYSVKSKT